MTTKERILEEALTLFSEYGYDGTSVKRIAQAVGIKDSSLYKHYKSKKEIFDRIVERMGEHIGKVIETMGIPGGGDVTKDAKMFGELTEEGLVKLTRQIYLFYLKDSMISRFWRMATVEQFRDQEVYQVYRSLFFEQSIEYQERLFAEMISLGYFKEADPRVMAVSFYTPFFFLISKYIGQEGNEKEALAILERQVREFSRVYAKENA